MSIQRQVPFGDPIINTTALRTTILSDLPLPSSLSLIIAGYTEDTRQQGHGCNGCWKPDIVGICASCQLHTTNCCDCLKLIWLDESQTCEHSRCSMCQLCLYCKECYPTCNICEETILFTSDMFACDKCNYNFHSQCVRLPWYCEVCEDHNCSQHVDTRKPECQCCNK
jgi:hypothetical protein